MRIISILAHSEMERVYSARFFWKFYGIWFFSPLFSPSRHWRLTRGEQPPQQQQARQTPWEHLSEHRGGDRPLPSPLPRSHPIRTLFFFSRDHPPSTRRNLYRMSICREKKLCFPILPPRGDTQEADYRRKTIFGAGETICLWTDSGEKRETGHNWHLEKARE